MESRHYTEYVFMFFISKPCELLPIQKFKFNKYILGSKIIFFIYRTLAFMFELPIIHITVSQLNRLP